MQYCVTFSFNVHKLIGQWMKISHFSFRLAVGVWVLMALVLVNVYSGNLFSYLAVPKLNPIPNTFDELADKYPQQKITLEANSVMADMFMVGIIQYFSICHYFRIFIDISSWFYLLCFFFLMI